MEDRLIKFEAPASLTAIAKARGPKYFDWFCGALEAAAEAAAGEYMPQRCRVFKNGDILRIAVETALCPVVDQVELKQAFEHECGLQFDKVFEPRSKVLTESDVIRILEDF